MNNAGVTQPLFASTITTALSAEAQQSIDGFDGISALNLIIELLGATGGSTISALVQTSFVDDDSQWLDVALFTFTTSAGKKFATLNALSAKGVTAYAALAAEGVNDGLLGNRFRAVISSTGTYSDTTLSIHAHAK